MIPQTYPSTYESYNGRTSMVVYELSSVIGLTEWIDYIPVKNALPSESEINTYGNNGAIQVDSLSSSTGLQAWLNYIPVYQKSTGTAWVDYIPVYRSSTFTAVLTNSVILRNGTGSATYTRATTATFTDHEDVIRPVLSGEVRFQGARRVYNEFATNTENITTGWQANTGVTFSAADRVVYNGTGVAGDYRFRTTTGIKTLARDGRYRVSFEARWVSAPAGTNNIRVSPSLGAYYTTITLTDQWQRYSTDVADIISGANLRPQFASISGNNDSFTLEIRKWMIEEVTGQSNQNPSEYVSVGVLSSPYHGAMVDGVKYFDTTNGNTVSSNVVTEASGSPISLATLKGYLAEGARTNLCLRSEDFGTTWTTSNVTVSTNQTTAPDGTATADAILESATTSTHLINQSITISATTTYSASCFVKGLNRTWCAVEMIGVDAAGRFAYFNLSGSGAVGTTSGTTSTRITAYPNGWYLCTIVAASGTGAGTGAIRVYSASADNTATFLGNTSNGLYVWGAQLEAGSFASSYIPTTTASVTRNADVLTYQFAGNADATVGSCYMEYQSGVTVGSGLGCTPVSFSTTQGAMAYINSPDARTTCRVFDGTNIVQATGLNDISTAVRKRATSWGGSTMRITGDGVLPASGSFDGGIGSTSIAIGGLSTGASAIFGTIRNVRIYQAQFTSAQLQAVTS